MIEAPLSPKEKEETVRTIIAIVRRSGTSLEDVLTTFALTMNINTRDNPEWDKFVEEVKDEIIRLAP